MTLNQHQALERIRKAAIARVNYNFPATIVGRKIEIKREDVVGCNGRIWFSVSAGFVGDVAGDGHLMDQRIYGAFLVGARGSIKACLPGDTGRKTDAIKRPLVYGFRTLRGNNLKQA